MTHNNIQYFCTAERCIWRVWTSPKTGYCSKIKCQYGNMREMRRAKNDTSRVKQSAIHKHRDKNA